MPAIERKRSGNSEGGVAGAGDTPNGG